MFIKSICLGTRIYSVYLSDCVKDAADIDFATKTIRVRRDDEQESTIENIILAISAALPDRSPRKIVRSRRAVVRRSHSNLN